MAVFMNKENFRLIVIGKIALLMSLLSPIAAQATLGWEVGDMVLDFGLGLESGEQVVLIDKYEVGHPFFVELTWKLNSEHCVVQIQEASGQGDTVLAKAVHDDGLFNGVVSHAVYSEVEAVIVSAGEGTSCEIDPSQNEFLVIARKPRAPVSLEEGMSPAPLGALVMVFRATTFFLPRDVIVQPGEKVVWVYADGAHEPHSVTSGGCRVNDCSGGGKQFNSGLKLSKPGQRFEHVFANSGIFPYHCDLHLGSMQGSVTVQAPH
jgi:plastocyanin